MADILLADRVFAPHYARAETCACTVPSVMLREAPSDQARAVSQLVRGEAFALLDVSGGWAWGRCGHDDYVGYLPAAALGACDTPTHRVTAPLALVFAEPDIKAAVIDRWPIGSLVAGEEDGAFVRAGDGFVHGRHVTLVESRGPDPVSISERLLGQPYLWGGRGGGGIDCSGLVQVALGLCGIASPRDSDLQRVLGHEIAPGEALRRGDLVFLPGHVGMMADGERLIHANAHWMAVTVEPLADVLARVADPASAITARRRLAA